MTQDEPPSSTRDSACEHSQVLKPPSDLEKTDSTPLEKTKSEDKYPPQSTVIIVMCACFLATLLVALDRTIIATAVPVITNHFNSLADVGWYASAYMLTMCGFQLMVGRIYTFYNPKWVYLSAILVFELGSFICGIANNSTTLIVGRAVAGLGSCGIFGGAIVILVYIVPLHKRPAYTGLFGAVFGVASVAGPLLGGAFTDHVSWRWCFYINLPLGAIVIPIIFFFLNLDFEPSQKLTWKERVMQLDPFGSALFIPGIICLLLVLQNGGILWSWSSARVIALLVLFGILMIGFTIIQFWRQETATVPPRILKESRSIIAGFLFSFCGGGSFMIYIFYLPIWFQAIKGASAMKSGIMTLPFVLGLVISSIIAGFLTKKIGYYTPWMYVSVVVAPIGAGLLTTFTTHTGHSLWIGYQALYGLGVGIGIQQPSVAAQTVLKKKDVSTGVSFIFLGQSLGGALFVSVANNIFDNKLAQSLATIPGLNSDLVTSVGATNLRKFVPPERLAEVLVKYNGSLRSAFHVATGLTVSTVLGAALMEWRSVKEDAGPGGRPKSKKSKVSKEEKGVEQAKEAA